MIFQSETLIVAAVRKLFVLSNAGRADMPNEDTHHSLIRAK